MKNEVAIIGVSLKMANAGNLEEYWQLIKSRELGVTSLSDIRKKDVHDRFGEAEMAEGFFLDRIDLFDNEFFGISPAESERMDPEQRLIMEHAVMALHNSGYTIRELKGKPIGIFHTYHQSLYRDFFDDLVNISYTSHMPGMVGARVANFMDWRGPVMGMNTSCSSALSTLYYACESISNGQCNMALVNGVALGVLSTEMVRAMPILSPRGKCLPFDKNADGTVFGEGVFCLVIKKKEDAIRDGDPIYAILKGGAVNHCGALVQNLTAPSPAAQAEVIRMAWEDSRVDPAHIRFIEAHGTGTILGDPIEFRGITAAFEGKVPGGQKVCTISSAKAQIGHLGFTSGFASVLTMICALQQKQLLPQHGFNEINTQIDETNSPVGIQREFEYWPDNGHPRRGGVSSFGLSGTNVHMVMEEYIAPGSAQEEEKARRSYMINIGAPGAVKAERVRTYLQQYLAAHPDVALNRLAYSVTKIVDSPAYSQVLVFKDREELLQQLNGLTFKQPRQKKSRGQVLLFIPNILEGEEISSFLSQSAQLAAAYQQQLDSLGKASAHLSAEQLHFLLHYCAIRLLTDAGLHPDKVIGAQSGKLMSGLLSGEMSITTALTAVRDQQTGSVSFNREGFIHFLNALDPGTDHTLLVMGLKGELTDVLKHWTKANKKDNIQVVIPSGKYDVCQELTAAYYNLGHEVQLEQLFTRELFLHDLHLPVFDGKRFWPNVTTLFSNNVNIGRDTADDHAQVQYSFDEIITGISMIWEEKLKLEQIDKEDDFFEIGGTSLMGLDILKSVEKKFVINLAYADIFDYCTIAEQAKLVAEKLSVNPSSAPERTDPPTVEKTLDPTQRKADYEKLLRQIDEQQEIATITPRHILLTGGTGFLGVFMIKALLQHTNAIVSCLVRADSDEAAATRLITTLTSYFPHEKLDYHRLHGVKGEVTETGLGLSAESRDRLKAVDTVHHLAASVSHYAKAAFSNKINYEGTVNVLEWAKQAGVNYFNHYSTQAVANAYIPGVESADFYESDLDLGQDYGRRVYPFSKFKAEEYIQQHKGSLQTNIFRIGNVGGETKTGLFQHNIESNNFYQRVKTLATLGCYCTEIADHSFETTPVDLVANTVLQLSLRSNTVLGTFHLFEGEPMRLRDMAAAMRQKDLAVEEIDLDNFNKRIEALTADADLSADNPVIDILKYGRGQEERTEFFLNQEATRAYLQKIGVHTGYDKQQYAATLLNYCIRQNFINSKHIVVSA